MMAGRVQAFARRQTNIEGMEQKTSVVSLKWLRRLSVLSLAVPLFIFALFGGYRLLEGTDEAQRRVSRSLRVAHEHASKVLSGAEALQSRIIDLVEGRTAQELRRDEARLHAKLKAAAKDQPQLQSIWIIGADGAPIASSKFYPVPNVNFADREYLTFHRQGKQGVYVAHPFNTRTTGERVLDLSGRFDDARGQFSGVVNISLATVYFEQFYNDLVSDEPGLAVNLFRQDGDIYTRWPLVKNAPAKLPASSPVMTQIAQGKYSAQVRGVSSVDGQERLIAFKKIDAYPVYLGTGMNLTTLREELFKELAALMAFGLPPFVALFLTTRFAVSRTREALESSEKLERETLTRRRAEDALLQAQKLEALGRLTGGVAHDFNNALMVISNNAFLLKRNTLEAGAKQLSSITRAVESATKLTRQLLAFSRRQALVPEYVRLEDRLPSFLDLIVPVLGSQIRSSVSVSPGTHAIKVDPAELELALLNLAINARDAMPAGGVYSVRAYNVSGAPPAGMPSETVVIEVADNGSGIDEALLSKVFEPFFTTKPAGHGTGLGLSQVYGFCRRAGGDARITSKAGLGTTVSLYFPAAAAEETPMARMQDPINRNLNTRVLLVEDNDEVAASLMPLLEALGCSVTRVDRAAAAREQLESGDLPDLVLSDVVMPGEMDGLALAQWARGAHPRLPLVLMTGYAEQIDAITGQGFEVLPKPCSAQTLSAAIGRLTRQGRRVEGQQ